MSEPECYRSPIGVMIHGAGCACPDRVAPDAEPGPLLAGLLPKMTEAKRLTLGPEDRLVLRFPGRLTDYQAAQLMVRVPHYLGMPGLKILILVEGMDVDVLGPGEDPPPGWGRLWQAGHP